MRNSKGQNVIEYVLLVVAIVVVCLYYYSNLSTSPMGSAVKSMLNSTVNMVNNLNSELKY